MDYRNTFLKIISPFFMNDSSRAENHCNSQKIRQHEKQTETRIARRETARLKSNETTINNIMKRNGGLFYSITINCGISRY